MVSGAATHSLTSAHLFQLRPTLDSVELRQLLVV
jgi:hypothetical protein